MDVSGIDETGIGILAGDTGTVTISATGVFSIRMWEQENSNLNEQYFGRQVTMRSPIRRAPRQITAKPVTVSGITASNKVYDGLTGATVDVSGIDETGIGILAGDTER